MLRASGQRTGQSDMTGNKKGAKPMSFPTSQANEVVEMWRQYALHRRVEERNALVTHYAPLAASEAARLSLRLSCRVSVDEIRCAAFDGLTRAVESFDPQRSTAFEGYCRRRISGAVLDWVRSVDPQSRAVRRFERMRTATRERLKCREGHAPTDLEVAAHLRLSPARFARLEHRSRAGDPVLFSAIEHRRARNDGGSAPVWDVRDMRATEPSRAMSRHMLLALLTRGLCHEERMVLTLYYFEDLTMSEIGAVLRLSESRISQIHQEVLRRLRQRVGERLREELSA